MMFSLTLAALALTLLFYRYIWRYPKPSIKAQPADFPLWAPGQSTGELARALIAQMTLREKIAQLYGEPVTAMLRLGLNLLLFKRFPHMYSAANARLGIPPFVLSDGPRGARVSDGHSGATTFPVAMARGASWDTALEARIHDVIAKEMRAIGANMAATPCINLLRHPGWGRAQEVYGEDPYHMAALGVAATRAVQQHNVMASPKHFALNSIENSRFVIDVEVDDRALHEVYLPHFKKVIQDGNTATLMTAYNSVRGHFMSENAELIRILRQDWGFAGFLHSDWVFGMHDAAASIKAGLNLEMPVQQVFSRRAIKRALRAGDITEADIDQRILESLRVRLDYALRADAMDYPRSLLACEAHRHLAQEAAEKSMVLLKNDGVLPFDTSGGKTIAVIGRLADTVNTGDRGSSNCSSPYVITPAEGIRRFHEARGNTVIVYTGNDTEQARQIAKQADQVVMVAGFTASEEGEYVVASKTMARSAKAGRLVGKKGLGGDRETLELPAADTAMIRALATANRNLAVTLVCGSAVDMAAWDNTVPSILIAWYAGMEGGSALARVLWGEVSPSGKLPFAIPANAANYPHFTPYALSITYDYYHGYTLFDKNGTDVAYPFGFGLSYSRFAFDHFTVLTPLLSHDEKTTLEVEITVTNIGQFPASEVVQLYIGFKQSPVDRPVRLLRGFQKIALAPGENCTLRLTVPFDELARYDPAHKKWIVDAMNYEVYVGNAASDAHLQMAGFAVR